VKALAAVIAPQPWWRRPPCRDAAAGRHPTAPEPADPVVKRVGPSVVLIDRAGTKVVDLTLTTTP
jgi:hypothetical protein